MTKPSFDIVRVDRGGNAVIAGHAAPGAVVTVRNGTRTIGQATADASGAWALVPQAPLPSGGQALTLSARDSKGTVVAGAGTVVLDVPPRAAPAQPAPALAMLTTPQAPPRLLQGPAATGTASGELGIDAVDSGTQGELRLSGHAPPGATLRVYVDNHPVGDARTGADGHWSLSAPATVAAHHLVRIDEIDGQGKVIARVEVPFDHARIAAMGLRPDQVLVQPGQSLWLIARRAYGSGVRYAAIYAANQSQIRDPDLIYPGQIFTLPNVAVGATPASASTSR